MKMNRFAKSMLFSALTFAAVNGFAQQGKYTIHGKIKGLPDGTKLELLPVSTHKNEKPIATAVAKNGEFNFTGTLNEPRKYYVKIAGDGWAGFDLFAEKGNINVTGKLDSTEKSVVFNDITVSGSEANDAFRQKMAFRKALEEQYEAYNKNNREISEQLGKAREKNDTVLQKELMATAAYKKLEEEEGAFFKNVEKTTNEVIANNKDTWWGPFFILELHSYLTPDQKKLYDQLSDEAKNSYYGKLVKENLYPETKVGKPAPSLAFENDNKQKVSFASLTKGKKYVVIDFWASWCQPCRKALPGLKEFYAEMKDKGVEIVSVSIDKKETDWRKALKEENMPWPNFLDQQEIADKWNVKAIPAMFIVDAKGVVVAENVKLEEIREKVSG